MLNAYKKTMKEVPNSMQGRDNPDILVHGMEGVPKILLEERQQKSLAERVQKDKKKEEEQRDRLKQLSVLRAAENRGCPRDEASSQPAVKRPASVPDFSPPQPPSMDEGQRERLPDGTWLSEGNFERQRESREANSDITPVLGSAVAKLLSGELQQNVPIGAVPGLHGFSVPDALRGLHPVALQVLAFTRALPARIESGQNAMAPVSTVNSLTTIGPVTAS